MSRLKFLTFLLIVACTSCSDSKENFTALATKKLDCPTNAQPEYQGWGESGTMARCVVVHGPVAVAEYGYLKFEGQYTMGRPTGVWRWYDSAGNVIRTETMSP